MKIRTNTLLIIMGIYALLGAVFYFLGKSAGAADGGDGAFRSQAGAGKSSSAGGGRQGSKFKKKATRTIDLRVDRSADAKLAPLDTESLNTLLMEIWEVFRVGGIDERTIARAWALIQHLGPEDMEAALEFTDGIEGGQRDLMMLFLLPRLAAFDGPEAMKKVPGNLKGQMNMIGAMVVIANWSSSQPLEAVNWLVEARKDSKPEFGMLVGSSLSEEILPQLFGKLAIEDPAAAFEKANAHFSGEERLDALRGIAAEARRPDVRRILLEQFADMDSRSDRSTLGQNIVEAWGRDDPRAALEWGRSVSNNELSLDTGPIERQWLRDELKGASEALLAETSSSASGDTLNRVANAWVAQNPAEGRAWLRANGGDHDIDIAYVHGATHLAGRRDYEEAVLWLSEISSSERQVAAAETMGRTWGRQGREEIKNLEVRLREGGLDQQVIDAALSATRRTNDPSQPPDLEFPKPIPPSP